MIELNSRSDHADSGAEDEDLDSRSMRNTKKVQKKNLINFTRNEGKISSVLTEFELGVDTKYLVPKISEGIYEAVLVRIEQATVFKTTKVFVWVRIITPGPSYGVELYRAYRVHLKPGKTRQLFLKPRSELRRMLCRVSAEKKFRTDRVSFAVLKNKVLKVKVRTVTTDYRQRPLDDMDEYSVIDDIISIETS